MKNTLLPFLFVLVTVALGTQWVQWTAAQTLPKEQNAVLSYQLSKGRLTITLENRGETSVTYPTIGYGEPTPEAIAFTIADTNGTRVAPMFFCGTGLRDGQLELRPGESLSRTYDAPTLLNPDLRLASLQVTLKTSAGVLSLEDIPCPTGWNGPRPVHRS